MRPAALRLAGAIAVLAGTAACSAPADRVGDLEDDIAGVLARQLHDQPGDVGVDCPDDDQLLPGSQLTCSVSVAGSDPVDVSFALGAAEGDPVRITKAVIPTADAETYLEGELATPAEGAVTADCGAAPFLVREVGATFPCDVTRTADGVVFQVVLTVMSVDGQVRHEVQPTTTTTATTATTVPPPP